MELKIEKRIDIVDALRGFALIGILLVHCLMFYLAGPLIPGIQESAAVSKLDHQLGELVYWLGLSKFYSLFSILFGLSFCIQQQSAVKKQQPFSSLFVRKMLLLAGFGFIHWGLFPGDILTMYAVLGVLLLPLSKLNTRSLFVFAVLLQLGLGKVLYFALNGNDLLFPFNWYESYSAFVHAVTQGNIFDVATTAYNRYPQFWNEQLGLWGRFYSSLGYFLLGIVIGRQGWLFNVDKYLTPIKWLLLGSTLSAVSFYLLHIKFVGGAWGLWTHDNNEWLAVLRFEINELYALSFSLIYGCIFVLFAHHYGSSIFVRFISSYGRTGLTTYISQSLLGAFVFFEWGLGGINHLTVSDTLWVFVTILLLQITFSHQWLKRYQYGPLEWLWRCLTNVKTQS